MNSRIKKSIFAGLFFGVMMGIFMAIFNLIMQQQLHFIPALISGIIFGVTIYLFTSSRQFEKQTKIDAEESEIVYSDHANHFLNLESVGGKLYLLRNQLIFKSHMANWQNHQLIIDLKDIDKIDYFSTLGIIPNGLKIEVHGKVEKFIVSDRQTWKSLITESRSIREAAGGIR